MRQYKTPGDLHLCCSRLCYLWNTCHRRRSWLHPVKSRSQLRGLAINASTPRSKGAHETIGHCYSKSNDGHDFFIVLLLFIGLYFRSILKSKHNVGEVHSSSRRVPRKNVRMSKVQCVFHFLGWLWCIYRWELPIVLCLARRYNRKKPTTTKRVSLLQTVLCRD